MGNFDMATIIKGKMAAESYSEAETQRRFEKLVRAALNTKPKPLKSMGPKGVPAQSKKRKKARS
jgi:hypothetical protein